jgi:hypothetical protein
MTWRILREPLSHFFGAECTGFSDSSRSRGGSHRRPEPDPSTVGGKAIPMSIATTWWRGLPQIFIMNSTIWRINTPDSRVRSRFPLRLSRLIWVTRGGDAGVQRRGNPAVAPAFAELRYVRLQQDAFADQLVELARSSVLNRTTYFLTAISFPTTNHLHRCLAATEIQKLPSFSMTGATRGSVMRLCWRRSPSLLLTS